MQFEWEFAFARCAGRDANQRRSAVRGSRDTARADQLHRNAQERIRSLPELGRLVLPSGLCVAGKW